MKHFDKIRSHEEFDPSNIIHPTAIIFDNVELGKNNVIGPYAIIGSNGEMRGVMQEDFKGRVIIGDNNVISELVTIQRPYGEDCITEVGSDNIIMAHSHIGHDVKIGDSTELCTGTIIGGYVSIGSGSKLKLGVTVRNRKNIGTNCIVGMCSVVVSDLEDDKIYVGNPAKELKK